MLKQFGFGSPTVECGNDLARLIGHLEALKEDEEETLSTTGKGLKWKRFELVETAISLLYEALDMGKEER